MIGNLLWRLFPSRLRDDLREELRVEYRHHVLPARGPFRARTWYARQFLGSLVWSHLHPARVPRPRSRPMESLLSDLRFALRSLRRAPGLAALAALTIAIGIGTSSVVFAVLNAIVLQPLPYPDADRIVRLWHDGVVSKSVMGRVMAETSSFAPMAGTVETLHTLTGEGDPRELYGLAVTPGYWPLMGARPLLGALPPAQETGPGDEPVVLLSERLWRDVFASDAGIIGRMIRLDGRATTVAGVIDGAFRPLDSDVAFWVPMVIDRDDFSDYQGVGQVRLLARIAPGIDPAAARADARAVADRIHEESPEAYSEEWASRSDPRPLHEVVVASAATPLWTTMTAVLLVLLIACANVANLLLARTGTRQREIAIRMGLGAGRGRIVRQLLTESLLLAAIGGTAGSAAAVWATRNLGAAWASVLPRVDAIVLDWSVLAFAALTTLAAALLFGVAPAWRASGLEPRDQLAEGGNASTSSGNRRLAGLLVTVEVALAVMLVIGAGLMIRTLAELVAIEPGFETQGVTTFRVRVPSAAPPAETGAEDAAQDAAEDPAADPGATAVDPAQFERLVHERLAALPGVDAVGAITFLPMATGTPNAIYWLADQGRPENETPPNANFQLVGGDYFRTMGIPLLRGRLFGPEDVPDAPMVGVINETLARDAFGTADPLGQRMVMFGATEFEVVGVVADSRQRAPERDPAPEAFFSFRQAPVWPNLFFVLRSPGSPPSAEQIRRAVWSVDATVPVLSLRSMHEVVRNASGRTRLFTRALGGFGLLALLLAAIGVYGVTRHSLGQQVREFGIRLALGATPGRIVREAVGASLRTVVAGAVLGVGAAALLTRAMQGLLFGVSAIDPTTFGLVPALLIAVGLAAAWLPARRVARLDPRESLGA